MIIALAGRRIDAPGANPPRFPVDQITAVKDRIKTYFEEKHVTSLVCSSACGADLLALQTAGELGIDRTIVLPFDHNKFRFVSVIDRPGNWGPLFDKIYEEVKAVNNVVALDAKTEDDDAAYQFANLEIFRQAILLRERSGIEVSTLLIWDGKPKDENDATLHFGDEARTRGIAVDEILTLP